MGRSQVAMGEALTPQKSARVPAPADHVALRTLMKYMSSVLSIPYKSISTGTPFDESSVKNYTNDKSSRSLRAAEMYTAFSQRCATIIAERGDGVQIDEYVLFILRHLFGDGWLELANLKLPTRNGGHALDAGLTKWLAISPEESGEVEQRYAGLWRCVRASSFPTGGDQKSRSGLREVNTSLLNIRPRSIAGGVLCDFRWYYLGRGRERDERRVFEGFVIPNVDRIEFLGRVTTRHKLLATMVWRFTSNPELREHAKVASGVALSLNTSGGPVGARMRAFFVDGSEASTGDAFEALKERALDDIGVKPVEALETLIPADQVQSAMTYLGEYPPIVGFVPVTDAGD